MSVLSAEMEFEVGDIVYLKCCDHNASFLPKKFIVAERFVQQCHGGIQKAYRLVGDGVFYERLYPEIVLQRDKPPYDPQPLIDRRENESDAWDKTVRSAADLMGSPKQ